MTLHGPRQSKMARWIRGTAVLVTAVLLAGCDPAFGGGAEPTGPRPADGGDRAGCVDAGPNTRDFLPLFPADAVRTTVNPCLGLKDLPSLIADLIPDGQEKGITRFLSGIRNLAAKVLSINDLVECGYQTDRLALGIYQDRATRWSVGVVAVTRGRVDALIDTSRCFLLKQIPLTRPPRVPTSEGPPPPEPTFCVETRHRVRAGQKYTVLWLGSSTTMCAELEVQLTPGDTVDGAVTATVKAEPNVSVRTGPSANTTRVRREPAGQVLLVTCYLKGQNVTGRRGASDRWYRLDSDTPEHVSGAWLDTGDNAERPPKCR